MKLGIQSQGFSEYYPNENYMIWFSFDDTLFDSSVLDASVISVLFLENPELKILKNKQIFSW